MRSVRSQLPDIEKAVKSGQPYLLRDGYLTAASGVLFVFSVAINVWFFLCDPAPADLPDRAWGNFVVLETLVIMGFVLSWCILRYVWMSIDEAGIHVRNPFNEAFIPWARLERAHSEGLWLKLYIDEWSVGVTAVQPANIERLGETCSNVIEELFLTEATRRRESAVGTIPEQEPWKRRRLPGRLLHFAAGYTVILYFYFVFFDAPWSTL